MTDQPANVRVETRDAVMTVTIERPEKRNALSRAVLAELAAAFTDGARDESLKAAVVTGAGDISFAAGGDLRDLEQVRTLKDAAAMAEGAKQAFETIRRFPVPVVAALNGDALGGGAELAVACDFRVFAHHARIGFVQGRLNISTAWGGGVDLMRLVGPAIGLRLLPGHGDCAGLRIGWRRILITEQSRRLKPAAPCLLRFVVPNRLWTIA